MGRKVEVLFRDDQLKPAVGAQRTQELIEKEKLPVHRRRPRRPRADGHQRADQEVQGAVHLDQPVRRDQRQARHQPHHLPRGAEPDHHLAARWARGRWRTSARSGGSSTPTTRGASRTTPCSPRSHKKHGRHACSAPRPIRSAAPSSRRTCRRSRRPSPRCWSTVTPGADNIAFLKQAISFGMKKEMKIAQPLHWISMAKEGGPELYDGHLRGHQLLLGAAGLDPAGQELRRGRTKKFNTPPGDYSAYAYSGVLEVARGVELAKSTDADKVADALRKNPVYDHYKGKQWWRACDNKSFQDMWIVKGRGPRSGQGRVGAASRSSSRIPATEEHGPHLQREGPHRLARTIRERRRARRAGPVVGSEPLGRGLRRPVRPRRTSAKCEGTKGSHYAHDPGAPPDATRPPRAPSFTNSPG